MASKFKLVFLGISLVIGLGIPSCLHAQGTVPAQDSANIPVYEDLDEEDEYDGGSADTPEEEPNYVGTAWFDREMAADPIAFRNLDELKGREKEVLVIEFYSRNGGLLPASIQLFKNLQVLHLEFPDRTILPKELWTLSQLEILDIDCWQGITIGPGIAGLEALKTLNINGLKSGTLQLDAAAVQLPNLESLNLTNIETVRLPAKWKLPKLKNLTLEGLSLQNIPDGLRNSPQIKTLNLSDNRLTELPKEISSLTQLISLYADGNKIEHLPAQIDQCKALGYIDLSNNKIQQLPASLGNCTQLKALELDDNALQTLPPELGQLTNLQKLSIRSNQLQALPSTLSQCVALSSLFAENNQLTTFPEGLCRLPLLSDFRLLGNPLTHLPSDFPQWGPPLECDRTGLLDVAPEAWALLNRKGFRIPAIPKEIAGRPLEEYLSHPAIDPYSKLYVQRKLALQWDPIAQRILDSVLTNNPETQPFYLHLLTTCLSEVGPKDDWGFDDFVRVEQARTVCAKWVSKQPCNFFAQVKNGPYAALYWGWVHKIQLYNWRDFQSDAAYVASLRATMNATCPGLYDKDLAEFEQSLSEDD
jgi:leucine-rich repeat protein SHOC2